MESGLLTKERLILSHEFLKISKIAFSPSSLRHNGLRQKHLASNELLQKLLGI